MAMNKQDEFIEDSMNCRDCKEFESCPCGKDGHESGTSQGYLIGECKDFEPQESEDKCKNCEYYRNPDYTRCHECKAESEDKE